MSREPVQLPGIVSRHPGPFPRGLGAARLSLEVAQRVARELAGQVWHPDRRDQ